MEPIKVEKNGKKGWMITHKCTKCGKIIPNKAADDDNFEKIIEVSIKLTTKIEYPRIKKTRR